jgi:hypothetical protein
MGSEDDGWCQEGDRGGGCDCVIGARGRHRWPPIRVSRGRVSGGRLTWSVWYVSQTTRHAVNLVSRKDVACLVLPQDETELNQPVVSMHE